MTNVKDIISDVVDWMKPSFTGAGMGFFSSSGIQITLATGSNDYLYVFVGEKMKVVTSYAGVSTTYYGTISVITSAYIRVTFSSAIPNYGTSTVTSAEVILGFHHGHLLEIVNTFKEAVTNVTYRHEMFPAICLLHDFPEVYNEKDERDVTLNVLILTDTDKKFKAADRYTYSFDAILSPLYEKFKAGLIRSTAIGGNYHPHTKYDRLYWGREGLYNNTGNLFNDFIDAIEMENLKLRILKTC